MLLLLTVSTTGERSLIRQSDNRREILDLFKAIAKGQPAKTAAVEVWDSNEGRDRTRALNPAKKAPALETILAKFKKDEAALAKRIATAQKADAKAAAQGATEEEAAEEEATEEEATEEEAPATDSPPAEK